MDRVIVGIDSSENSTAAAEFAAELARDTGSPVVAVHALGLLERFRGGEHPVPALEQRDRVVDAFENVWCAPLVGLDVERRVVDGSPVTVLLRIADQPGDVIVLGTRGAGAVSGMSLGSTSAQLVAQAPVPVVIVPLPQPAG